LKTSNFEYAFYNIPDSVFPIDRCKGNNARRTLVLVEQKDFEVHGVLLTKILRAVELEFERDVSFISLQKNETLSLLNTSTINEYDNVLLFGVKPNQIGLKTQSGSSLLKLETLTIIVSESLDTITKDTSAKRNLWVQLKRVFKP